MTSLCLVRDLGYRIARSLEDDALSFYIPSLSGSETSLVGTDLGLHLQNRKYQPPICVKGRGGSGAQRQPKGCRHVKYFRA